MCLATSLGSLTTVLGSLATVQDSLTMWYAVLQLDKVLMRGKIHQIRANVK